MKRTSTLRRMLGTGLGSVVLGATVVAMAAPAGAADAPGATGGARRHRVHLTAGAEQCLRAGHHPADPPADRGEGPAAQGRGQGLRHQDPAPRHLLTAEQKQCLADHGMTRPIRPADQGEGRRS